MSTTEWRVLTKHPRAGHFAQYPPNEHEAREWARLEAIDYPHFEITVESREVGPWHEAADPRSNVP